MKQTLLYIVGALLSLATFLTPLSASALGLSFGTPTITAVMPCVSYAGPSVWITIVPAGGDPNVFYVWTPTTLGPPPVHTKQEILGLADIPYFCCAAGAPIGFGGCYVGHSIVPSLPVGERIQYDGVSI